MSSLRSETGGSFGEYRYEGGLAMPQGGRRGSVSYCVVYLLMASLEPAVAGKGAA